jgi:hypothetical protein
MNPQRDTCGHTEKCRCTSRRARTLSNSNAAASGPTKRHLSGLKALQMKGRLNDAGSKEQTGTTPTE